MSERQDDALPTKARALVLKATRLLVAKEYDALARFCGGVRLSAVDLARAVAEHDQPLSLPLDTEGADIICLNDGSGWSVVVDLQTKVGRSDLSLELTILRVGDDFRLEVDDLHTR